jgi:uncharacterized membrane protein
MKATPLQLETPLSPSRVELRMSAVLRVGTLVSLVTIASGMVITFLRHPDYFWSADALSRVTSPASSPHRLGEVMQGLAEASGRAVTMTGMLLLIALPVLRLAIAWAGFRAEKEKAFTQLSLLVLGLLMVSFLLGAEI